MGSVLTMEHARPFRELAADVLCRDPRTFFAYDMLQALALARHLGGAVTLVELDQMGSAGLALIQRVRESYPEIPVICVSRLLGVP